MLNQARKRLISGRNEPNQAIFGPKPTYFSAKRDAQISVNYVFGRKPRRN
jgi:hypothetical protein